VANCKPWFRVLTAVNTGFLLRTDRQQVATDPGRHTFTNSEGKKGAKNKRGKKKKKKKKTKGVGTGHFLEKASSSSAITFFHLWPMRTPDPPPLISSPDIFTTQYNTYTHQERKLFSRTI